MVDPETQKYGKFCEDCAMPLFHIIGADDLEAARQAGIYELGLETEGFIHLSGRDQVLTPANLFYAGRTDLSLLTIDEEALTSQVVREPGTGTDVLFPHLYGPLNLDAITGIVPFPPNADGKFEALPDGI